MGELQRQLLVSSAPHVLRDDQRALIADLGEAWLKGHRRIVAQAACGFGKTVVITAMTKRIRERNPRARVCIVVGRIALAGQTLDRLVEGGVERDLISIMRGDDKCELGLSRYFPDRPIQIVSHQTAKTRGWPDAEFYFVDECHEHAQPIYAQMDSEIGAKATWFGFTATPWSKGLGRRWQTLVKGPSIAELVELKVLSPWVVYAPKTARIDTEGVAIDPMKGDYRDGELTKRCTKPTIVADVVRTWLEMAEGRPTLVFAVGVLHAQMLAQRFNAMGIPAGYIDADTERTEREAIGKRLQRGELRVVVNIETCTTGLDWPFVSCIQLCRPTKSAIRYVQIIGRGLRSAPGKSDCIIIDHSATSREMGCITELEADFFELDTDEQGPGTAERKPRDERRFKLRECKKCDVLSPPHAAECLGCGTPFPIRHTVNVVDGELVEIGGSSRRKRKAEPTTLIEIVRAQGKAHVYAQLKCMAPSQTYKDPKKWTDVNYKEIFGCWPAGFPKNRPPERPTPELSAWIEASREAWKRRAGNAR
jgi:DNA repair protein RadD